MRTGIADIQRLRLHSKSPVAEYLPAFSLAVSTLVCGAQPEHTEAAEPGRDLQRAHRHRGLHAMLVSMGKGEALMMRIRLQLSRLEVPSQRMLWRLMYDVANLGARDEFWGRAMASRC